MEVCRLIFSFMKMMGGQIPGMEELVKGLRVNGYRVFGLSNWSVETFALVRPVYPVLNLMEDMVISGVEKVMKPDHRIFELALNRFGIKAEETIFLDDNPANVQAACELGIKGILFNKNMIKNEKAILNTDGSLVLPEWLRQD